jgi:hypothetical protein
MVLKGLYYKPFYKSNLGLLHVLVFFVNFVYKVSLKMIITQAKANNYDVKRFIVQACVICELALLFKRSTGTSSIQNFTHVS